MPEQFDAATAALRPEDVRPGELDLADTLTVASTALLATATWLATVILADRMRHAGYRGPFELLVRRVTYGRQRVTTF